MSYAATALIIAILIAWVILDGKARIKELKQLEASGARRRSTSSKGV